MVLYKDGINENVIYENIKDVAGDDSVLFVRSINNECNDVYYKIIHDKGQHLIKVININSKDYLQQLNVMEVKYGFHDEAPCVSNL